MALDPALLEILVCPECKTAVSVVNDGAGLQCGTCHRIYPVKDDIPVMLVDEAEVPATSR
ncbi:MAG: Trm112 family protein [Acidobacteria bacterium]|nr:Trm112 family protein [Acidobacteriota bacterium]